MGQLYNQLIIDLNGNMSKGSYLDNRNNGSADFDYKREEFIYFIDIDHIQLLDYKTQTTPVWYSVIYSLRGLTSTLDGKYILTYKNGGPNNTS